MTAFAAAVAAMFRDPNMAVAASYTATTGGAAVPVRLIRRNPDIREDFGASRIQTTSHLADVQAAELPNPEQGGRITIGSEIYRISAPPQADRERLIWSLELVATA
jgi:hypothetical protein